MITNASSGQGFALKARLTKNSSSWLKEYRQLKLTGRFLEIVFNPFQRVLALSHEIDLMVYRELMLNTALRAVFIVWNS